MAIRIGCCGFAGRQADYYRDFPAIEIQQTFYQPPRLETARRWRQEAPAGFAFTLKAWQLITHEPSSPTYRRLSRPVSPEAAGRLGSFRPTGEVQEAWQATLEIARALRAAVVVFQCPARFTPAEEHVDNLSAFFSSLERSGMAIAWEPRGDWPQELVAELCRSLDLIHCVDPFTNSCLSDGPIYFRLHGIGGYRYRYSDSDLEQLFAMCQGRKGHVMFNNMTMREDALRFMELLGRGKGKRG